MSDLGQKRTLHCILVMSALPPRKRTLDGCEWPLLSFRKRNRLRTYIIEAVTSGHFRKALGAEFTFDALRPVPQGGRDISTSASCPLYPQKRTFTSVLVRFVPKAADTTLYSNAKMRFQSFFMLMTVQPSFFASS
jgi:hypothetical protein